MDAKMYLILNKIQRQKISTSFKGVFLLVICPCKREYHEFVNCKDHEFVSCGYLGIDFFVH